MRRPAPHEEDDQARAFPFILILSLSKDEDGFSTLTAEFLAKAGIKRVDSMRRKRVWIPAFAGKTGVGVLRDLFRVMPRRIASPRGGGSTTAKSSPSGGSTGVARVGVLAYFHPEPLCRSQGRLPVGSGTVIFGVKIGKPLGIGFQ